MKKLAIIALVTVAFASVFVLWWRDQAFQRAKADAMKEYLVPGGVDLNCVPQSPVRRILPKSNVTNTVSAELEGYTFGLPADRFQKSPEAKASITFETAMYRVMVLPGFDTNGFDPIMRSLNQTNCYDYMRAAFGATVDDISRQRDMESLRKLLLLLKSKGLLFPAGFDALFLEFDTGDLKGFVGGDPAKDSKVTVLIYVTQTGRFFEMVVRKKTTLQLSDIDELLAVVRIAPQSGNYR